MWKVDKIVEKKRDKAKWKISAQTPSIISHNSIRNWPQVFLWAS